MGKRVVYAKACALQSRVGFVSYSMRVHVIDAEGERNRSLPAFEDERGVLRAASHTPSASPFQKWYYAEEFEEKGRTIASR